MMAKLAPAESDEARTARAQAAALARYYQSQPEYAWQDEVETLLLRGGWAWVHVRDARRQRLTGFPDLFAVRGAVALAAELKTERGRVTPEQGQWLATLAAAGVATYVWRPSQVDDVRRVLLGTGGTVGERGTPGERGAAP